MVSSALIFFLEIVLSFHILVFFKDEFDITSGNESDELDVSVGCSEASAGDLDVMFDIVEEVNPPSGITIKVFQQHSEHSASQEVDDTSFSIEDGDDEDSLGSPHHPESNEDNVKISPEKVEVKGKLESFNTRPEIDEAKANTEDMRNKRESDDDDNDGYSNDGFDEEEHSEAVDEVDEVNDIEVEETEATEDDEKW